MPKFFGTPPSVHVGQQFVDRRELHDAGVHRPLQGGISGNRAEGADSIVVSGGYGDDADFGDYILYTGHGGKAANSATQIAHQSVDSPGNAGLITSMIQALPVRVVRGAHKGSPFAPPSGYRYAGLYLVTEFLEKVGRDGFQIVLFRLERLPEQEVYEAAAPGSLDPAFATTTVTRRIRDSQMARELKKAYAYACQLCGSSIEGFEGRLYAEGAHVRPLGKPHSGTDASDNLLCLCPNHHTQLDIGGLFIRKDLVVEDRAGAELGSLTFKHGHTLLAANAEYHWKFWKSAT